MLVADEQGKVHASWGKEFYALDANGNAQFVQSLTKAVEAFTASISLEEEELTNSEDLQKLWEIEPTVHRKCAALALARRFFVQLVRAWDKPCALRAAAKRGAHLLIGVRNIGNGEMEVIFEEGLLSGTVERPPSLDASGKRWLVQALRKAIDIAERSGQRR